MAKKRLLYVIASQHLKVAGGIGQFLRGLQDFQYEMDLIVDVAMDQAPNEKQKSFVRGKIVFRVQRFNLS
jgi:hypothetical protein